MFVRLQPVEPIMLGAYRVALSPDGRYLACSSYRRTVEVWDLATGQEVLTLRGHSEGVRGVAFSPDGRLLASAGSDGAVKVWDATPLDEKAGPGRGEPLTAETRRAGGQGRELPVPPQEAWNRLRGTGFPNP